MIADSPVTRTATIPVTGADQPRFAAAWAAITYDLATLALGWQALAGKLLVGPHSDQYIAGYAFREFAASVLRKTGSFPLWNPYQFSGMPFVGATHGDIFYPTFLLRLILPTDVAMTWGFIVHVFLAGFLAYVFLRRAGFSFAGSLIGGLAYMMSGHIATYVSPGHDGKLFVSALFPLLLWTILAWVRDGRLWAVGAMALVVGLDVLTPHPQLLEYSLLAAGAYAVTLAVGLVRDGRGDNKLALTRIGVALGAVIIGLAIGAIQFLPVREYVQFSPRAGGIGGYDRATSFAKNPEEILNAYVPEFTGTLDRYWGANGIHFESDYVGAVVLVLAGAGLAGMRRDLRSRELWFWAVTVVVALLWALGGHTPFYRIPYYVVPGTRYFRAPDSVFFVGTLGISVFVARGVERLLAGEVSRRYAFGWLIFATVVALMAAGGVLTGIARAMAPEQRLDVVDANNGMLILGAFRSLIFVGLICAFVLRGRSQDRTQYRAAPLAILALLTAADLWIVDRQYWIFSPPATVLYAPSPAVKYLSELPQPGRVVALPLAEPYSAALYIGSTLMIHRVSNVFGYHSNQLARYNTLVGLPQGAAGLTEDGLREVLGNANVRRLTATQYVLSNSQRFSEMLPGAVQVAGPATDDPSGNSDYAFRIPGSAPYAWVAPLIVKAPDDAALVTIKDPRFNIETAAIFDTSAHVAAVANVSALPAPTGINVKVDEYRAGHVVMTLDRPAPAGAALVAAENYYPGWHATVDGKPAAVGRAQFTMIGVQLSQGARRVQLDFASSVYQTGKIVTWVAILVGIALLGAGLVAERRRRV
ncbi:MAG: YfhO family protein [Gemmatimonadaceae bacterium]